MKVLVLVIGIVAMACFVVMSGLASWQVSQGNYFWGGADVALAIINLFVYIRAYDGEEKDQADTTERQDTTKAPSY